MKNKAYVEIIQKYSLKSLEDMFYSSTFASAFERERRSRNNETNFS